MNKRLMREAAFAITEHCLGLLVNVLDDIQKQQAREGLYAILLEGIEEYAIQQDRMRQRLKPLQN
jgi:hypothetical protein